MAGPAGAALVEDDVALHEFYEVVVLDGGVAGSSFVYPAEECALFF
jgi:hypothetical protein